MLPAIPLVIILILSVFIAYLTVRRRNVINSTTDVISMIPYIVPGVVIGTPPERVRDRSAIRTSSRWADDSQGLLPVIRRLPYTIRSATAICNNTVDDGGSRARSASKFKTFYKVTVPMMARASWRGDRSP